MIPELDWLSTAARQFERPLICYVRGFVHDHARAADIVQDAFVKLLSQNRADVEPRLAAWLYAVCRRRAIDVLRKEQRMTALSDAAEPPVHWAGPAESTEKLDTAKAVLQRLGTLPASQQEAVRLRFLQQFSYREIAGVMGLTETHVGVLIHTAIKTLRGTFADRPHPEAA
jgi:RNA polymerase sigma factor (sigma-70 family)